MRQRYVDEEMPAMNGLRRLVNEWEFYHITQLKNEDVEVRIQAHKKRDEIEMIIQAIGFMPCYVDDCLMLIVY